MGNRTRFRAILFDLDGTILEFKFPVRESRIAMLDYLRTKQYDINNFRENMRTQDLIDQAEKEWKESLELRATPFSYTRKGLFKILDKLELKSLEKSVPIPGSLEMISFLNEMQLATGVVTNTGQLPAISVLSKFGFISVLRIIITRNEVPRMKPAPDMLLEAKKRLALSSAEILFVGDSVLDIEAAKAAGIQIASIPSGSHSRQVLENSSPDFMLNSMNDLSKVIFFE